MLIANGVMRPDQAIDIWKDEPLEVVPGVTLIRCGGHFPGSAVLHWAAGTGGKGVLLTGDTIRVVMDRRFVSFMWSYPNLIPLSAEEMWAVTEKVKSYQFDRLYGGWWGHVISEAAKTAVQSSAERYSRLVERTLPG